MPAEKIELFENGKIVAISTGSSKRWLSKRWGVESYNRLVIMLVEKECNVVLVGDELSIRDGELIESQNSSHIKNFINKTGLNELKNILKSVDLFVGNDSGPAHIAASVGTDTVTIFGSTSVKHCVKNFMYIGEHISIAPKNLECCPCYRSSCPKSGNEHMKCMKSISVENVFSEIVKILG
ncbi:MAG: glycosyltransferase family 9 protein [Campylobacteraceae bacterium]|jgi:heptosyltransferase-2|nr:glycosyltransferase family 9 protein [Campylobacteraceae bacterium]